MAGSLVDTNVLVYRFDGRFPEKQRTATELLRAGIESGTLFVPHQAIVEFVAAVRRPLDGEAPLLEPAEATREAEELLSEFDVLYPDADSCAWRSAGQRHTSCRGSTRTCGRTRSGSGSRS